VSVHPDKTAVRAVDACGGTYTTAEIKSEYAAGHTAAICEAMRAVVSADALTAELLDVATMALHALVAGHNYRVTDQTVEGFDFKLRAGAPRSELEFMTDYNDEISKLSAVIAKATGADQ